MKVLQHNMQGIEEMMRSKSKIQDTKYKTKLRQELVRNKSIN